MDPHTSSRVRANDNVALLCEYGRIPPRTPSISPCTLRSTMNEKGERINFLGREIAGLYNPSMNLGAGCGTVPMDLIDLMA